MRFALTMWLCLTGVPVLAQPVNYDRDVRPILSDRCFACHGPDEAQRMAKLRLDTPEGASTAASRLYQRITSMDNSRMPPLASGPALTNPQKDTIRRWIEQGAKVTGHWAYTPPKRLEPPAVLASQWPRNPIDRFILSRLEHERLNPSPEAGRAALIRRLSFDLTGLPPAPAEVQAYLNDASPDAYEKVVDRLLASPHYGERMAMPWLDLARYADTDGYQVDSLREMWPWRDWVIRAFNRNMPFDQFTVEQLAGDLLPGATREQQIATGFNRNHRINSEDGAIADEYQVEYVVDRVETTAAAWLGSTLGCARCHDHKYDPFSQRDFYRFFAYFNHVPEPGLGKAEGNTAPVLQLPTPEQQSEVDRLNGVLVEREQKLSETALAPLLAEWEKTKLAQLPPAPREGLLAHYGLDDSLDDLSGSNRHARVLRGHVEYGAGPVGRAAVIDGATEVDTGVVLPAAFSVTLWEQSYAPKQMSILGNSEDAQTRRGFEMLLDDSVPMPPVRGSHLIFRLIGRWPADLIEIRTRDRVTQKDWRHVVFTYDGSGNAAGARVYVDGQPVEYTITHDALSRAPSSPRPVEIGNPAMGASLHGALDDLWIYSRPLTPQEVERLASQEPVRAALLVPVGKRTDAEKQRLRGYFLTHDASPDLRRCYAEHTSALAQRDALNRAITSVMVMREMEKPRDTFVLAKGDYRNKAGQVTPGLPEALSPPAETPPDRLGLARWLVDPSNPLTARVTVNRYWAMYFGAGLVRTVEDFGSRGETPSHPELLDWLATEFVRTGWDVKAIQRLIVTSAAYRQASAVSPALLEKDPENRLLARGPRFRLPAEMIRDHALAAAGLLNPEIGGPGVFPYQPAGLWEETSVVTSFAAQVYTQSHGKDLYRRSVYTFWKRTVPAPSLAVFDEPDREKCTARRTLTNTPMQALALMNDPTYVEAARVLAQRVLKEAGALPGQRAALLFRLTLSRQPSRQEERIIVDLAERNIARYRKQPDAARKLLAVGESKFDSSRDPAETAGWAIAASAILNLDETITKE